MFCRKIILKNMLDSEGQPSPARALWISVENIAQGIENMHENYSAAKTISYPK
ncbi:hypothetical protein DK64_1423 [Brucella neotomae 5K33]|nr:hypothetical protein DK64_1423 [Brucella neotomae 5K33]